MIEESRVITLPSGKIGAVRKARGRDLMHAHRVAAGYPEPVSISFALIAEVVQIEGKQLVYEDILDMDLDDVLALENEISGAAESHENFPHTRDQPAPSRNLHQPEQSSDSSGADSHTRNSE
jgi:hypothetical protein